MALRTADSTANAAAEVETQTTHSALDSHQPRRAPAGMERALSAMQEQVRTAQREIVRLGDSNKRLRHELVSLARRGGAQAHYDGYHDELTCLPNRRLLLDRLDQAMGQASRQHKQVLLLLLDLAGFRAINDAFGHGFGDKLLQAVAERLVACVRSADTACRYGGDQFVVMLPEIDGEERCANMEEKIRARMAAPYLVNGIEARIDVSIGTAVFPVDANDHNGLLTQAIIAMHRAKTARPAVTSGSCRIWSRPADNREPNSAGR